jgi:hypothetical protein
MSIFPKLLKFRIELMFIKVNFQNKKQKQNKKNVSIIRTFWKCKSAIGISKDKKASILKSIDCIENKFKYFYQNLYVNNKRKRYEIL